MELLWPGLTPKAPASQGKQSVPFWYVPRLQGMHAEAAAFETSPASQGTHVGGSLTSLR